VKFYVSALVDIIKVIIQNIQISKFVVCNGFESMNIGETLGIYELEIKHSKQFRASSIWEILLVILTIITNA